MELGNQEQTGWMKIAFDDGCHVTWCVARNGERHFLHAIGDGDRGSRVTDEFAQMRFDKSRLHTPGNAPRDLEPTNNPAAD